MKLIIFIEWFN